MNNTAVIQIGNSDDKLPQRQWAQFVIDVQMMLQQWRYPIHFSGASAGSAPWQNACWVVEVEDDVHRDRLRLELSALTSKYSQDSIALTFGDTEFVKGG